MNRALCSLLVLFAIACAACAEEAQPLTTILLEARPDLPDPNFKGSIVLVMNNIGSAPGGVIINRPTRVAVSHLFPDVEGLAQLDAKLYFGGPVQTDAVSFLFRADAAPENALEVVAGVYLSTDRALLRKLLGRPRPMEGLRIFAGYSGWAPGQLEAEVARGDWKLRPASAAAIFDNKSERQWPEPDAPDSGRRI